MSTVPSAVPGDHHTTTAPESAVASLTDHDLAILAARLTDPNVTALPWVNDAHEMYQAHPTGIENMGVWVAESCDPDTVDGGTANAALIVAAVNALPGLLAEVKRLRAALAEEERACAERGKYLAEVDAALIAAGQDEAGGYIAYARRIQQLAGERDKLRAELADQEEQAKTYHGRWQKVWQRARTAEAKVNAVAQVRCWTNEDGKRFLFADDVLTALKTTALAVCTCGAAPVHQHGCQAGQ